MREERYILLAGANDPLVRLNGLVRVENWDAVTGLQSAHIALWYEHTPADHPHLLTFPGRSSRAAGRARLEAELTSPIIRPDTAA